jgi:hypothetical protein
MLCNHESLQDVEMVIHSEVVPVWSALGSALLALPPERRRLTHSPRLEKVTAGAVKWMRAEKTLLINDTSETNKGDHHIKYKDGGVHLFKLCQPSLLHSRVQIQFRNIHSLPVSPQLPIATAKSQANLDTIPLN